MGAETAIKTGTGLDQAMCPSTIVDLSLDFTLPLVIFKDNVSVRFYGTWVEGTETPVTTATAVYDLQSTDYVGAFVKKAGSVNVDAYINDVKMDKTLENNEYMLTKELPVGAPIKLRLELSRPNVSGGNNDKITRILGGVV